MTCKCGHEACDHPDIVVMKHSGGKPRLPCTKCDCGNYRITLKEMMSDEMSGT